MINKLRKKIDKIDKKILLLLKKRFAVVKELGEYKKQNDKEVFDPERERFVKDKVSALAKEYDLDEKLVEEIFEAIMSQSRKTQG